MNRYCIEPRIENSRCSDEYYDGVVNWIKAGRDKESGEKCHCLAVLYNDSLDKLLVCLRHEKTSTSVQAEIDSASECQLRLSESVHLATQTHRSP
jgi:hypothetical protein